jgi:hypothetical protein
MIEFNKRHGEKIAEAAGFLFNPTHDVVVARTDDRGKLLGGVVFYDYTGRSISMHVAGFDSDGDMIVGRLRAEECRWLNIKPRHITCGGKNGWKV